MIITGCAVELVCTMFYRAMIMRNSVKTSSGKATLGSLPVQAAALSYYWKLWLGALHKGFKGDECQALNEFNNQAMANIHEDVHNDRQILSMMDLMALTDPPSQQMLP
jgi:hypothetical protein